MKAKILTKTRYLLVFVLIAVIALTVFPTVVDGGSAEQVQAFVTRFYEQCLNRPPDQGGLDEWVSRLLNGSKTFITLAAAADFHRFHLAGLIAKIVHHLLLDGQSVAVPAGHVGCVEPGHLLGLHDEILEQFVQCVAGVEFTVRVWRAIVKDVFLPSL